MPLVGALASGLVSGAIGVTGFAVLGLGLLAEPDAAGTRRSGSPPSRRASHSYHQPDQHTLAHHIRIVAGHAHRPGQKQEAIMKIRKSIIAAGAAIVLGGTGALALPAVASAHSATHTLKFTAVTVNSIQFTKTSNGLQETDVNSKGKTIGFDDVNITLTGKTSATGDVAIDISGGFLYSTVTTTNAGKTFTGKVTGGTGAFTGATGKVTGKAITSSKTAVTITYST